MLETIQSLWIGDLSKQEEMCICSFLKQGHKFHLYSYNDIKNLPHGAECLDANVIVPETDIKNFQNLANFSDWFRYWLLFKNGGWWVDLDVYCLSPFNFDVPIVLATQLVVQRTNDEVTSCVIKMPKISPVLAHCLNRIVSMDTTKNAWSALGPALLVEVTKKYHLQQYVQSHEVFCPLHYFEAPKNIRGKTNSPIVLPSSSKAVHLWNEERRRAGYDSNFYHPDSLYAKLLNAVI